MPTGSLDTPRVWTLPPLILHPFCDASGPGRLIEGSRASLMLQGVLPAGTHSREDLERQLLAGRYCELRMVCYIGKDLLRWIQQCLGVVEHAPDLSGRAIRLQSFAELVVDHPPEPVEEKLLAWGVTDFRSIFRRAIGLNSVFAEPPDRDGLAEEFIRNYHWYADQLFTARMGQTPFAELDPELFHFSVYASGEYAQMLEREWEEH